MSSEEMQSPQASAHDVAAMAAQVVVPVAVAASAAAYEFEYHAQMKELPDCPCALTGPYQKVGFRMVRSNLQLPDNLQPMAIADPIGYSRIPNARQCVWWGLSMFDQPDDLRRRFTKAKLSTPLLAKRIGTHFVCFGLDNTLGRISASANNGHFEFFPYKGFHGKVASATYQMLYP